MSWFNHIGDRGITMIYIEDELREAWDNFAAVISCELNMAQQMQFDDLTIRALEAFPDRPDPEDIAIESLADLVDFCDEISKSFGVDPSNEIAVEIAGGRDARGWRQDAIELNSISLPFDVDCIDHDVLKDEIDQLITERVCDANPSVANANWGWCWYDGDDNKPYLVILE